MCTKRVAAAIFTAVAVLLPSGLSTAQADPVEDPTGYLASDNVAVHTVLPEPAAIGARFRGDLMYVTSSLGLSIYDVSDPVAPVSVGRLPLPHFENEDVDLGGDILLISNDAAESYGLLHVIDISDPAAPTLLATHDMKSTAVEAQFFGGPGHTASCIQECKFAWVTNGGAIRLIDLRDPANPANLGIWNTPVGGLATHDVQVDGNGLAWISGFGGAAAYSIPEDYAEAVTEASAAGASALTSYHNSLLVVRTNDQGKSTYDQLPEDPADWPGDFGGLGDGAKYNDFILHNSRRLANSDVLYVTEEDYNRPGCRGAGSFETWQIPMTEETDIFGNVKKEISGEPMIPLDKWETEMLAQDDSASALHPTAMCSAHYFDIKQNVVAQAWYEQGLRLLDVSDPAKIEQIGYFIPPNGESWAAYFAPTDPTGRIFYLLDASLGIVVLEFDRKTTGPTAMPKSEEEEEASPPMTDNPTPTTEDGSGAGASSGQASSSQASSKGSGSEVVKRAPCSEKKAKKARRACRKRRRAAKTSGGYRPVVAPIQPEWQTEAPRSAPSRQFGYACRIPL